MIPKIKPRRLRAIIHQGAIKKSLISLTNVKKMDNLIAYSIYLVTTCKADAENHE